MKSESLQIQRVHFLNNFRLFFFDEKILLLLRFYIFILIEIMTGLKFFENLKYIFFTFFLFIKLYIFEYF